MSKKPQKSHLDKEIAKRKNKENHAKKKESEKEQKRQWKERDTDASGRDAG